MACLTIIKLDQQTIELTDHTHIEVIADAGGVADKQVEADGDDAFAAFKM